MKITNFAEAVTFLRMSIKNIDFIGRFDDISIVAKIKKEKYLFQFKREYYHNFSYHFPDIRKADGSSYGWAQIMNLNSLNRAIVEEIDKVAFITPDGKIYCCYANLFKKFYIKYKTDVPHLAGEIAMPLDFFERLETNKEVEIEYNPDMRLDEFEEKEKN